PGLAASPPCWRGLFCSGVASDASGGLVGEGQGGRVNGIDVSVKAAGFRARRRYIGPVVKRVLLAAPRGYCAGVERAVETVERALEQNGAPVYVRKQIVHNTHVVRDLE